MKKKKRRKRWDKQKANKKWIGEDEGDIKRREPKSLNLKIKDDKKVD